MTKVDLIAQVAADAGLTKKDKNWAEADAIRDQLASMGWAVEDTPQGPKVVKK